MADVVEREIDSKREDEEPSKDDPVESCDDHERSQQAKEEATTATRREASTEVGKGPAIRQDNGDEESQELEDRREGSDAVDILLALGLHQKKSG